MATILVIDDDPEICAALGAFFERGGHHVVRAATGEEGIEAFRRVRPELTLLDLRLPDLDGFEVMARVRHDDPTIIMITGHADVRLAVRAMHEGAENFLAKPVDLEHLAVAAERALEKARLKRLNRYVRERRGLTRAGSLLGSSPEMREIADQVELVAGSDRTTALILGESGTGKGRVAEAIHAMSPRAGRPFVDVNCAGQGGEPLDAELFGQDRGSLASGGEVRPGLIEAADGGTLFLDEIGELDAAIQPKLLRILEGRSYRRVGGTQELSANVRILAATTRDLAAEVSAGRFREELYYRLSIVPIYLPPLRLQAREDLLDLVARALEELRTDLPGAPRELTDAALDRLLRYHWPGNVRELRNVIERAMIVGRGARRIGVEHLPPELRRSSGAALGQHVPRSLAELERAHIERTLRAHNANRTHAAQELGISRATLINKIRIYGLKDELGGWQSARPDSPDPLDQEN